MIQSETCAFENFPCPSRAHDCACQNGGRVDRCRHKKHGKLKLIPELLRSPSLMRLHFKDA